MIERFGERGGNRTFNLVIKSHLLCQLSYAPVRWMGNTTTANAASDNIALRTEIFASFTNEFVLPQSAQYPETVAPVLR